MRGSLVVLALAIAPFVAPVASAQGSSHADSVHCVERQRGNPSDSGLAHRADPTTKGNKDCAPPVVYGHTSVSGSVFFDLDLNGIFTDDEIGLAGWQLQITGPMTLTTMTDGAGNYSFAGLTPGSYTLCVLAPIGWTQTSPVSGPLCTSGIGYSITAPAVVTDTSIPGVNFGWISN